MSLTQDDAFVSVAELARLLGVSKRTVRAWSLRGVIPEPVRLGERILRWRRADVMAARPGRGGCFFGA